MRLLNAKTKELELRHDNPPYAIVSHRWGTELEEVLFTDIHDLSCAREKVKGYEKILNSCSKASEDGLSYVWLDTCCIDKRNEKELTAAINSMYEWYHQSAICYAYLHDVNDASEIPQSAWFQRGWTLQEFIAPKVLNFFASDWTFLGSREDVIHLGLIPQCIRIQREIFGSLAISDDVSIAQRMSWAAGRETTEEEDMAYSLLGLFDVHLPAIYGIKQKAFRELQLKIMSRFIDKSLFAWKLTSNAASGCCSPPSTGLLAASPSQYRDVCAYEIPCQQFYHSFKSNRFSRWETFSLKNGAVCVTLPIRQTRDPSVHEALLRCSFDPPRDPPQSQRPLIVYLKQDNKYDRFVRIHVPNSLESLQDDSMASFALEKVHVNAVSHPTSHNLAPRAQTPPSLPQNTPALPDSGSYERSKTVNILVCGEPGAGAGGVVNLIAGREIVDSQTEFKYPPMTFTTHDVSLDSRNMRIFYAIGPRDHLLDTEGYHRANENVIELAQALRDDGGVHLLLCCMLRTKVNQNIHCLFYEALCGQNVPVIVLATGFAGRVRDLQVNLTDIRYDAYASISVVRPHTSRKSDDYERSVDTVRKLLVEHTTSDGSREAYLPRVGRSMRLALKEFMPTSAKYALPASD
ncbi:Heterokaryon incompatibility protein (HET) domain containing protein [Tylopilus felleus]